MPIHTTRSRRQRAILLTVLASFALTACSGAPAAAPSSSTPAVGLATSNCGFAVKTDDAPRRIVTIKSSATEMVVALGQSSRIVGSAFLDGPIPEDLLAGKQPPPLLSEKLPSQEAAIKLRPDLIYSGWESSFTADGVGDRSELASLGITSYVSPAACRSTQRQAEPIDFDDIFDEIQTAGALLGANDEARQLIDEQRDALEGVHRSTAGLTAVWYSSGTDSPYVGAGDGVPQLLMSTLGLQNVFAGIPDTWASVSWEEIVDADPDVIIIVDASWNTAESKLSRLRTDPALSGLSAVRRGAVLIAPFSGTEAGVRTVPLLEDLVAQLEAGPAGR